MYKLDWPCLIAILIHIAIRFQPGLSFKFGLVILDQSQLFVWIQKIVIV